MKHPEAEAAGARKLVAVEIEEEQAPARREGVGSGAPLWGMQVLTDEMQGWVCVQAHPPMDAC